LPDPFPELTMTTPCSPNCGIRFFAWIARAATAFHLWCAERELRLADTSTLSPALRQARERNLDLLRE